MHLILYSKIGCHLCEGLQEKIEQITDILKSSNFADKVIVKLIARKETEPEVLITLSDSF